jgi:hypothetical protein
MLVVSVADEVIAVVSDENVVEAGPKIVTTVVLNIELAAILLVLTAVVVEVDCVLICSPLGRYSTHSSGTLVACTL